MKSFSLLLLGAAAAADPSGLLLDALLLDESTIRNTNAGQSLWVAAYNARFAGMTVGQARALLGVRDAPVSDEGIEKRGRQEGNWGVPPTDFDCREQWPTCMKPIRDQGECGACWAFGAAEVLSDRFCISGGANVTLSPQDLVSCDVNKYNSGCDGGVPEYAWKYLLETGISTESCIPYAANNTKCPTMCADGTAMKKYKASEIRNFQGTDAATQELRQTGPLQVNFLVYQDFFAYKSGIYFHNGTDAPLGKHSVKLVGYGVDQGVHYWTVANSWGAEWGDAGYFKIKRDVNECSIEDMFSYGFALTQVA